MDSGRDTGAFRGAGLNAVLAPPSLSLAAMLAHVFGFGTSAEAACAGLCAGVPLLGRLCGLLRGCLGGWEGVLCLLRWRML